MAAGDGTVLTLAAARAHLRVSASTPDEAIADVLLAAEERIESFLGRPLVGDAGWTDADAVPRLVAHCVKLALTDFYVNREAPELTDDQLRPMIGRHMVLSVG
ncbi:head-tail connector protein [Sphingomonas mucosissima]|uniref:Phage gp6-like head-tail connector protein n=1 Tax=Sphingomonas mucosissima TaxID=370959 RepID=A0A245ZRC3_9SPHN|nr:head-tail connector protein [Sphingomonas mucosissima]OWK32292.1 hypothetical protein SPMU_06140 [Sphingomonas mucosissima]